jgi:small-conductance mechanosensitive channel
MKNKYDEYLYKNEYDFNKISMDKNLNDKEKIILILISELNYILESLNKIIYSNNEMKKYLNKDELSDYIKDNINIFKKNLIRIKEIKNKIKLIESTNNEIDNIDLTKFEEYLINEEKFINSLSNEIIKEISL